MPRDYAYEALAEVTSTDQSVGRGELNFSLKKIREQEPDLTDSYLLSVEIHDRARMYRAVFDGAALTPTALAKHWLRVKEETAQARRGGTNLHADVTPPMPPRRKDNYEHAQQILAMLKGEGDE